MSLDQEVLMPHVSKMLEEKRQFSFAGRMRSEQSHEPCAELFKRSIIPARG